MEYLLKKCMAVILCICSFYIPALRSEVVNSTDGFTWMESYRYCLSKNLTLTHSINAGGHPDLKDSTFWFGDSTSNTPWIEEIGCMSKIESGILGKLNTYSSGFCQYFCNNSQSFAHKRMYPICECLCLDDSFPWKSNAINCIFTDSRYHVFSRSNIDIDDIVNFTDRCLVNKCINMGQGSSPQYTAYGFSTMNCRQNLPNVCRDGYNFNLSRNFSEARDDCDYRNSSFISDFDLFCRTHGESNNYQTFLWSSHRRLTYSVPFKEGEDTRLYVRCGTLKFIRPDILPLYNLQPCTDKLTAFACLSEKRELFVFTTPEEAERTTNAEVTTSSTPGTDQRTQTEATGEFSTHIFSGKLNKKEDNKDGITSTAQTQQRSNSEVTIELVSSTNPIYWTNNDKVEVITLAKKSDKAQETGFIIWGSLSTTAFIVCLVLLLRRSKLWNKLYFKETISHYQEMEKKT